MNMFNKQFSHKLWFLPTIYDDKAVFQKLKDKSLLLIFIIALLASFPINSSAKAQSVNTAENTPTGTLIAQPALISIGGSVNQILNFFGFKSYFQDGNKTRVRGGSPALENETEHGISTKLSDPQTTALALPCTSTGVTRNVPGTYPTIQAAINASNPSGGDTIQIGAGTYTEQLLINKCLFIKGAGQNSTTIKSPTTLANSSVVGINDTASIIEIRSNSYVTMSDLTVAGPVPFDKDVYGIFVVENATLKMSNARVTAIHKSAGIDGVQRGNAVRAGSVAFNQIGGLDFDNVTIDDYQKTGVIVSRAGSTATIANSTFTGAGAQTDIAQNGIQLNDGVTGTVTNNTISGNVCNNVNCSFDTYYSYGILAFDTSALTVSGNTFNNNDAVLYSASPGITTNIDSNTVTQVRYSGFDLDQGTSNVSNNFIVGSNFGPVTGIGVLSYTGDTANTVANLHSNSITGASQAGISVDDFDTGDAFYPVVMSADFNRIAGNAVGIDNNTGSSTVSQTNNFWGCNQGPNGGTGCDTTDGLVEVSTPYLILSHTMSSATSVNTGGTSTITANLRYNSAGADTFTPTNHLPNPIPATATSANSPNGIPVSFTATNGTVNPAVTSLVGGLASTTFTGGGPFSGNQTATVTAKVDNATDFVDVTVNDTTAPDVTVEQASGQADPTNVSPVNFTAVFTEVMTGFDNTDVSTNGSTAGIGTITVTNPSNDGKTYNIAVSPTSDGIVKVSIPAGAAFDPANNGNNASMSNDNMVTFFANAIEFVVDDLGVNCLNNGAPVYMTIQAAVAAAGPGYIINVCPGTYPTSTNTTISLAGLTIKNAQSAKPNVNVSGGSLIFTVLASNVTISGLNITKTDTVNQNVIQVQGTSFKGLNNDFTATTMWSGGITTRAFEISSSAANFLLDGNTITDFRQPAYINGSGVVGSPVLGTVSNNTATRTKGFVVAGANINFTGNVFGQTCAACGADIALFSNSDPTFYTPSKLLQISTDNDDAYISVQFPTNPSPSGRAVTFVDDSAAAGGDGRTANKRQTIQDGINNTLPGGTVNVSAGTYPETLIVDRGLKILGAKTGVLAKPRNVLADESTIVVGLSTTTPVDIRADNVTFDGFNFDINQTNPTANNGADKPSVIIKASDNPGPGGDGYQNIKVLNNRLPYSEAEVENTFNEKYGIWFAQSTDSLAEGNYIAGFPGYGILAESGSANLVIRNNDTFNNNVAGFATQGNFTRPGPQLKHNNLLIENNRFDRDEVLLFQVEGGIARTNNLIGGQLGSGRFNLAGGNNNIDITGNTIALSRLQGVLTYTYSDSNGIPYSSNSNIDVVGNTFTRLISPALNGPNSATTGSFAAIDYRGTGGTNTIANNTLSLSGTLPAPDSQNPSGNSSFGIRLRGSGSGNFTITSNNFNGNYVMATGTSIPVTGLNILSNTAAGVPADTGAFPASSLVNVNCNTFTRFQQGVSVFDTLNNTSGGLSSGSNITINNNNIVGNSLFGVNNGGTSATINAQMNYWGAADGPGPVGPGSGDKVSTNVDYSNFLMNPTTCGGPATTPPPTVTINQAAGQSDPTSTQPINFTVVFSEPVTGFGDTPGDVVVSGSAFGVGVTPTVVITGSGTTYNVAVSGMTQSGTVTASVPAGAATGANDANVASTSNDNTVFYNYVIINPTNAVQPVNPVNITTQQFAFVNEGPTGSGALVTGPATPPLGTGSAQLTIDSTGRENLVTGRYGGTRLADISALQYSAYTNRNDNLTITLQFDVDYDLTDTNYTYQNRLVYEPAAQSITVAPNTWQTFDTLAGRFYSSNPNNPGGQAGCTQATPCTKAQLLAAFPNVGIFGGANAPFQGGLYLRAGGPFPGGMVANADNLVVGINGNATAFDFEPSPPTISINSVAVTEGNSGTTAATFTITQSAVSALDTTVTVSTADGSATTADNDYQPIVNQNVTIPAGSTSTTVTVNVVGDTNVEGNETFRVNLSNALNAAIADPQGTGTINNDDVTVSFSSPTYSIGEGGGTATITVTRSGVTPNSVTVDYATGSGSATGGAACTAGVDFINTSGTLTFAGNETTKTFTVTICEDNISEPPPAGETVNLTLSNPTGGAALGLAAAVLSIIDNDGGGLVTISGNIQMFNPGSANTNLQGVTVTLSGSSSATTTTDQNGNYSFTGLTAGGSYKVTPSGLGKIYDPIYRNYSSLTVNITNANFIAYNSISDVPRKVRFGQTTVSPGNQVTVPILLDALGNENGVSFSFTYDTTKLNSPVVTLGADAQGATIFTNMGTPGTIGVTVAQPSGQTFGAAGTKEIVRVQFNTAANTSANTALTFTNSPVTRSVNDVNANPLQAQFINGTVVFAQGLEADVDPRPSGDGDVDLGDFNQIGQFAAGLATPDFATTNEFQRADCEPTAQKGDGDVDLGDFIQAGRYAAILDPVQSVGGQAYPTMTTMQRLSAPLFENNKSSAVPRVVSAANVTASAGSNVTVAIQIDAEANDKGTSFTLDYDTTKLSNPQVSLGNGGSGGFLVPNTNIPGKVIVQLAYINGGFQAGVSQIILIQFTVANNATGIIPLTFNDTPVQRQVRDANNVQVAATFNNGSVSIGFAPTAATASVEGQLQNINGRGVANAQVIMTDSRGEARISRSNSSGYFRFIDLPAGETYIISVKSKQYTFLPKVMSISQDLSNLVIVAEP